MNYGNLPGDGNFLTLNGDQKAWLSSNYPEFEYLILPLYGAQEFIRGLSRYCLWIEDADLPNAIEISFIAERIEGVRRTRAESKDPS